jgi:hypothetical protein
MNPVQRLRILVVSPYPAFPLWSGGKIRMVEIARGLAQRGHNVTLMTPFHPTQKPTLYCDEPFRLRQVFYPFLLPLLLTDRPFPYMVLISAHPGLRLLVAPIFREMDVIQFEHVSFAGLLRVVPDRALVSYDAQNIEFDYVRQECRQPCIAKMSGRRMFALEHALLDRSDRVFPVSPLDQDRFEDIYGLPAAKCTLAPNGIPSARRAGEDATAMLSRFPGLERFHIRTIYSGSDVAHNRLAVEYLLKHIASKAKDVGFVIHGNCGRLFEQKAALSNVFFDTDYRTFADYAVAGTIGLNPVVTGGGTNMKVLHYLSHGLPVLSTPFGMRGLNTLEHFVRICEREHFPQVLMETSFPDPPDPEYLMERYSWVKIAHRIAHDYEEHFSA